jgi:hypothetical protein
MANLTNQHYTADELKQVEFLLQSLQQYQAGQDKQYTALTTKITFLFGFIVAVLTLYGTYASQADHTLKSIALVLFGLSLLALCGALINRSYSDVPILDTNVNNANYFSKAYQAVANLKQVCKDNDKPLTAMENFLDWGIRIFTAGLIFLMLSFVFASSSVVKSNNDDLQKAPTPTGGTTFPAANQT